MLVASDKITAAYKATLPAVRGNTYFIAPSGSLYVAGRLVSAAASKDGLTPFTPITIDEFFDKKADGRGDLGVMMVPGTYQLEANIADTDDDWGLMAGPGLHRRSVSVYGVTGAPALDLRGNNVSLMGFEAGGFDADVAAVRMRGRYPVARGMHFTSKDVDVHRSAGLELEFYASIGDAAFAEIEDCDFSYVTDALRFEFVASDFGSITQSKIMRCRFMQFTSRAIMAHAVPLDGAVVADCYFGPLDGATVFITMDHANTGADEPCWITNNFFAHASLTATQLVVTTEGTRVFVTDNRSKLSGDNL